MLTRQDSGFTLVELLVTIVILGILATLALPSFDEFIARTRLRSSAESILNALQLTRTEAVRRNEKITFTLGSGAGGSSWKVADSAGNIIQSSRDSGEGGATISAAAEPASASEVSFNGFGKVAGADGLRHVLLSSMKTALTVQVEILPPGGMVRMCDPEVVEAGSPKRCFSS